MQSKLSAAADRRSAKQAGSRFSPRCRKSCEAAHPLSHRAATDPGSEPNRALLLAVVDYLRRMSGRGSGRAAVGAQTRHPHPTQDVHHVCAFHVEPGREQETGQA
jgi:hypothetical protein